MTRTSTAAYRRLRRAARAAAKRDGLPCALCGRPIDYALPADNPWSYELDHRIPYALGGTDTLANSQPSHKRCNRQAGGRLGAARRRPTNEPRVIRTRWY